MTPLGRELARRIARDGPITVAEFMAECLTHPRHGYYTGRDPLGAEGDFTTAPEISQMFGELLGLCLVQAWIDQGVQGRIVLAEAGPGRGTLMADILRAARVVPEFLAAAEVHLMEVSPRLRSAQAERLSDTTPVWHESLATLPDAPLFLVANEFLDALPVRQFLRQSDGWSERMVALVDGRLSFAQGPTTRLALLEDRLADAREGDIVEVSMPARAWVSDVAERIARRGGAALLVDYGGGPSLGDTLQAMAGHAPADPLAAPGEADITAHVDFAALGAVAREAGAAVAGPVPQGTLLERLGIGARAEVLARGLAGDALESHHAALRRLTLPGEMGHLFKAMAIHQRSSPPPPGLAP